MADTEKMGGGHSIVIRDAVRADHAEILRLNEANVEVLSPMDEDSILRMAQCAELFQVAEVDGRLAGFLIVMRERSAYWSENYRWFCERYPKFLYVDRIVIDERARKLHIGRTFYEHLMEYARETAVPCITAEIDIAPIYNAPSIQFHKSLGFAEVGTKLFRKTITVSLQKLDVEPTA